MPVETVRDLDGYVLRPIGSQEWREARDLRLRALQDEDASIAFLSTFDEVVARPDDDWQTNARAVSVDAPAPARMRQFVAVTASGAWVASVVVVIEDKGSPTFGGGEVEQDRGHLVAVWVDPGHRGRGLLDGLVQLAVDWLAERGIDNVALWVHEDNVRAQRAYARVGFAPTGKRVLEKMGLEIEMARGV